jgi:hypothetical protein
LVSVPMSMPIVKGRCMQVARVEGLRSRGPGRRGARAVGA